MYRSRVGGRDTPHTPLYRVYKAMKERCNNSNAPYYHRYGGRGITVCDEWATWQSFAKWAHGSGYDPALSIDRIDNDGDYTPANCKWSTSKEQAMNRTVVRERRADGTYGGVV